MSHIRITIMLIVSYSRCRYLGRVQKWYKFFQNLTASFVVRQFLPSPNCNFHRELSNEQLASTCKTKEYIKINDPEFISKNNSLSFQIHCILCRYERKKRFWNLKSVMQEQIASWILCANGCVNEIIIKTVIFNKTTTILFNIFANWKTCYIRQKGFFISGSIISVAEWLPDRGTIWSTLAKAAWNWVIATILFVSKSFIRLFSASFIEYESYNMIHTVRGILKAFKTWPAY